MYQGNILYTIVQKRMLLNKDRNKSSKKAGAGCKQYCREVIYMYVCLPTPIQQLIIPKPLDILN